MLCPFLALLLLMGGCGVLVWLGWRRVTAHLQQNPEAAKLVSEHVITPLLVGGKKAEVKPEVKKTKGTLV